MQENPGLYLLGCAGKKSVLMEVYKKKLELFNANKPRSFEPILHCHSHFMKNKYPEEIIVNNSLCTDTFLGKGHSILNIKHKLNADGYVKGSETFHDHPYWGSDTRYLNMIKKISEDKEIMDKWNYGISKLSY
jgi:hypothetical protein